MWWISDCTVVVFEVVDVCPRDLFLPGIEYLAGALKNEAPTLCLWDRSNDQLRLKLPADPDILITKSN